MLLTLVLSATGCGRAAEPSPAPTQAGLPNPASAYCEEQGGRLEIRTDASGGQAGFCLFADGSECDEWAFFRGECQPGGKSEASPTPAPSPAAEATATPPEGWEIYTHPALGYSFLYPAGSDLETDDVGRYITVVGPLVNDAHWPSLNVAHPDQEDYHPPADADLHTWLTERNRIVGKVLGTRTIAGTVAIHTRNNFSPQAYDDDRFYFVHAGQVYEITIVHTAEEDWSVYDMFLNSFHF